MKKLFMMALVLLMGLAFAFTSCAGGKIGSMEGEKFKSSRWVDDNTFQITGTGAPKATIEKTPDKKQIRRASARRAAILDAQYQVLEKFKGSAIEGAAGMSDFESTGIAIAQEVQGFSKGGSVESETFDQFDNCEIVYQVQAKDLKKKVQAAEWK